MRVPQSGLQIDNPAFPLLMASVSYWGLTSGAGAATGLTVVCADLANHPSYVGLQVKLLTGPAAGQVRTILISAAGTLTVDDAFRDNTGVAVTIAVGTLFVILSQSAGGGGPIPPTGPSQGLSFMGDVTTYTSPVAFASTDLAGFGAFAFVGTYFIYVFRTAAGAAPQGQFRLVTGYTPATGTFAHEAFSAPLAVGDKVVIVHISVLFPQIVARGTFTLSDLVNPEDNTRAESGNAFRGCILMPIVGAAAFQPRLIVAYTGAGGIFSLDPGNPFADLPGLVRYVILKHQEQFVPLANGTENRIPADVIGNKTDTATPDDMSGLATSSLMRDLKRALLRLAPAAFTATIQGAARTDLAAMAATLATYFKAAGATYSATVGGAAKADIEDSLTALAAYFNAASAALSVTIDNGGAARSNLNDILSDLGKILNGAGITTFPAGAAAANGVNVAAVIRYIQETVLGYEGATSLANKLTAARAAFLDAAISSREASGAAAAALAANAYKRQAGVTQIFQKVVQQAANLGAYTLATMTGQACFIKDIVVKAVTAVQTDLTSAAVTGGAGDVITFLSATDAAKANITAIDQQVAWNGAVELAATKIIKMTLVGTGATAVNLLVTIRYEAVVDGGYLA